MTGFALQLCSVVVYAALLVAAAATKLALVNTDAPYQLSVVLRSQTAPHTVQLQGSPNVSVIVDVSEAVPYNLQDSALEFIDLTVIDYSLKALQTYPALNQTSLKGLGYVRPTVPYSPHILRLSGLRNGTLRYHNVAIVTSCEAVRSYQSYACAGGWQTGMQANATHAWFTTWQSAWVSATNVSLTCAFETQVKLRLASCLVGPASTFQSVNELVHEQSNYDQVVVLLMANISFPANFAPSFPLPVYKTVVFQGLQNMYTIVDINFNIGLFDFLNTSTASLVFLDLAVARAPYPIEVLFPQPPHGWALLRPSTYMTFPKDREAGPWNFVYNVSALLPCDAMEYEASNFFFMVLALLNAQREKTAWMVPKNKPMMVTNYTLGPVAEKGSVKIATGQDNEMWMQEWRVTCDPAPPKDFTYSGLMQLSRASAIPGTQMLAVTNASQLLQRLHYAQDAATWQEPSFTLVLIANVSFADADAQMPSNLNFSTLPVLPWFQGPPPLPMNDSSNATFSLDGIAPTNRTTPPNNAATMNPMSNSTLDTSVWPLVLRVNQLWSRWAELNVTIDFAYRTNLFKILPGVTVELRNLTLIRLPCLCDGSTAGVWGAALWMFLYNRVAPNRLLLTNATLGVTSLELEAIRKLLAADRDDLKGTFGVLNALGSQPTTIPSTGPLQLEGLTGLGYESNTLIIKAVTSVPLTMLLAPVLITNTTIEVGNISSFNATIDVYALPPNITQQPYASSAMFDAMFHHLGTPKGSSASSGDDSSSSSSSSSGTSWHVVVGATLGAVGGLLLILVLIVIVWKHKKWLVSSQPSSSLGAVSRTSNVVVLLDAEGSPDPSGKADPKAVPNIASDNDLLQHELLGMIRKANLPGNVAYLTLQGIIGEGSTSEVYRCDWRGLPCAVKYIPLGSSSAANTSREVAIMSIISHPNIVCCYSYNILTLEVPQPWQVIIDPVTNQDSFSSNDAASSFKPEAKPPSARTSKAPSLEYDDASRVTYTKAPGIEDIINGAGGTAGPTPRSCRPSPAMTASTTRTRTVKVVEIIMELCELGSLAKMIAAGKLGRAADGGAQEWEEVLQLAFDIALAMAHLHKSDIIHGDLKPANILLSKPQNRPGTMPPESHQDRLVAKVADFGLSVFLIEQQTHKSGVLGGTLYYAAPEVVMEGRMGRPADVYAFGIILWELFHGAAPWVKQRQMNAWAGHSAAMLHSAPSCPPQYDKLWRDCTAVKPEERPTFPVVLSSMFDIITSGAGSYSVSEATMSRVISAFGSAQPHS